MDTTKSLEQLTSDLEQLEANKIVIFRIYVGKHLFIKMLSQGVFEKIEDPFKLTVVKYKGVEVKLREAIKDDQYLIAR